MVVSLNRECVIIIYRLATVCVLYLLFFDNRSGRIPSCILTATPVESWPSDNLLTGIPDACSSTTGKKYVSYRGRNVLIPRRSTVTQ